MEKNMSDVYLVIQNDVVTNLVVWDGNPDSWTPPADSIQLVAATTPAKVWVHDPVQNTWSIGVVVGEGGPGFTWDGTYVITNEAQPDPVPTRES